MPRRLCLVCALCSKAKSIAYRPMPRDKLVPWLKERGLTDVKGCFREKYITAAMLDALYARMDSLNTHSKNNSGGNRV